MKHFNIDNYKYTNDVVMWCKDEAEAAVFEKYLDSVGRKWCNGASYVNGSIEYMHDYPCFRFGEGTRCSLDSAFEQGWEILKLEDYIWDDELIVSREAFQAQTDFLKEFAIVT